MSPAAANAGDVTTSFVSVRGMRLRSASSESPGSVAGGGGASCAASRETDAAARTTIIAADRERFIWWASR